MLPETERVWKFLKDEPSLAGFVLVGGTALALRLGHRRSEDLDLISNALLTRQACLANAI